MQASKPCMRTRKVVNYVAMNGDASDDSEDDTFNDVNIKVTLPSAPPTKPSKVSKLKLGTRKQSKLLKGDDATDAPFTNSKPILDHVVPMKLSVTSSCLTSNMEDNELSIAEPELITHSIFSQETVITSTCECLSPHEFTDSSESDTYSSTVEITSAKEGAKLNKKPDPLPLKTSEDRIIKRRIINESLFKQKKIKIDVEEMKNQNTSPVDEPSITKPAVDVSTVPPQLQTLHCSLLDKSSLENALSPHQHLAGPFTSHDEASIFQEGSIQSPIQPTNQLLKEDHSSETEYAPRSLTLNVETISEKSVTELNFPTQAMLTPVSTKRRTEDEPKRKVQAKKNPVVNCKLKNNLPNTMESGARPKTTPIPTTMISGPDAIASSSAIDDIRGLGTSREVASLPYPVNILKPPSPLSSKPAVKWKPPGKAGGNNTPLGGNSPAIGIRLGLSRNRRASKPLHPDVKVKL